MKRLGVDPKPWLVVFGFDQDQRKDEVWKEHRIKLERRPLRCWGDPASVRLDW